MTTRLEDMAPAEITPLGPPLSTPTQEPRLAAGAALSLAIIESAEDAIFVNSLDGTVIAWNDGAARLFGYSAEEMIGGPVADLFPADRQHEDGELIARLVMGKTISHFVTRHIRKEGGPIDVSLTLSPVRDDGGAIVAVSRILRNITETQQRHLAFALSAAIVEHSDDAIISKSLDGTVLTWNSGAARMFGYSAAEMIGGSITQLFAADRLHEEAELIGQLTHGKKISHFVTQRLRKNGSLIDVSVALSPVRDEHGRIIAISKIARDITDTYQRQLASALSAAIVEHSDDAIISKTLDGTVITWNLGAQQIFGYTAAEMIGGPILRLFPADRLTEELDLITQVVLGRGVDHFVTRRLRKDGTSIDVSVTLTPVRDAHGQIVAVLKIARDITAAQPPHYPCDAVTLAAPKSTLLESTAASDRSFSRVNEVGARANQELSAKIDALVRNEQRFQTLVRLTSQVIWTTNPQGHFDSVQPGWAAFTGQSFDEYQGAGWSAAVHPDYAQPTIDEWTRCVAERRPFLFEQRVRRHDGEYRTCTINAAPVFSDDGTIREWVGVHNDITERRQQENEIRAQEAKFRVLTEAIPQLVWTSKPDGWMDYFNQRWFDYTGLTLEQSKGWGWGSAVHPDDVQHCVRTWNGALESGKAYEVEFRFRRASDGSYRWHLGRGVPFRDAQGAILKWLGTATDIEDYKAAESRNLALQAELEARVQQRTAELARVGKITGVGGWSFTVAGGAVHWSDETCRILDVQPGYQPTLEEAIGMYVPGSREVLEAAYQNCMANAVPYDLELQLTTATGRSIWVRGVGEAQMEQGVLVRIFGALQDITSRKLAELELFDQHELLRVTLESIGDAVITTDAKGRVQSINPIASRLTGRSASEVLGLPVEQVFDIVDAQTRQRTLELMTRALSNDGTHGTGGYTVLTARDGTEIGIEDSVSPIRDKSGNRMGTVLVFRDVSERKRAAHALRIANERFTLAADAASIGVWEWNLPTNVLRWDDQMYRLYGRIHIASEEPYSLWAMSLHPEDRCRAEREINDALRANANFDSDFRIVLPDGQIRHLRAVGQIQRDASETAISMIGVNFDITARKQAELDLQHTSSLLRRVLDSASELSIIATTPDLTIRVFNKGAERLLGYAGAEIIDSATPMAFHDDAEVETRRLELSILLGRSVPGAAVFTEPTTLDMPREWTYIRKDQSRVPVLLNCAAMHDDSGALTGYLGVARDITRDREHDRSLREAKSEAERANAAKSEFLANMSHEIRTPLNAVIGLGYLLEQTPLNEEQRSFLRKINFAGHSLLEVINDILDLSKIEAGEMLLEETELDLKNLVQGIGQMLMPSANAKCLALEVHCAADLPSRLYGDATRLGQIATNLLNNAIKFTETGRVDLTLSWSKPTLIGLSARLSVRDTGIGMDAKGLARLFRPFSQADTSTSRRFGGTGLGLSIVRRLVDLMGGEIGVTSTVGVGSEFSVEIPLRLVDAADPLIERALPAAPDNSLGTLSLSGVKILVVDDSDINREVAQLILRRQGATVATSGTGAEAVERLRQDPSAFEIILMDIQMPGMDGNEAARRIRSELQLKTLPIIALTAGALLSERDKSLRAGMNDFLTKPFEPAALIGTVRRHVERKPSNPGPIAAVAQSQPPAPLAGVSSQIDSTVVQTVFGGDTALFLSLLARMVRDFGEFALPVSVEFHDAAALIQLRGRLHKLKGGAGMIGATTVHHLAGAAEAALAADQGPDMVGALLRQLAAAFTALGEELGPMLAAVPVAGPGLTEQPDAPVVATLKSIDRLLQLLDEQNIDVLEQLSAISPSLRERLGEACFTRLQEAVNSLDFSTAAVLLRASPPMSLAQ